MSCGCGNPDCDFEERFRALVREVLSNHPREWVSKRASEDILAVLDRAEKEQLEDASSS